MSLYYNLDDKSFEESEISRRTKGQQKSLNKTQQSPQVIRPLKVSPLSRQPVSESLKILSRFADFNLKMGAIRKMFQFSGT